MKDQATAHAIRELPAGALELDPCVRPYLDGMTRERPVAFIDNAPVEMHLLDAWGTVLPVVVVEPASGLPDICSPIARFAAYPRLEIAKRRTRWIRPWAVPALHGYGGLMRACHAERAVYVNNWMLATNPETVLSANQYRQLNAFLQRRYPHTPSSIAQSIPISIVLSSTHCRMLGGVWSAVASCISSTRPTRAFGAVPMCAWIGGICARRRTG